MVRCELGGKLMEEGRFIEVVFTDGVEVLLSSVHRVVIVIIIRGFNLLLKAI